MCKTLGRGKRPHKVDMHMIKMLGRNQKWLEGRPSVLGLPSTRNTLFNNCTYSHIRSIGREGDGRPRRGVRQKRRVSQGSLSPLKSLDPHRGPVNLRPDRDRTGKIRNCMHLRGQRNRTLRRNAMAQKVYDRQPKLALGCVYNETMSIKALENLPKVRQMLITDGLATKMSSK
ncbi:unnamed protein product [Pleuronectes platessa]|uniref:Uncharacterized protein n=1 Tax=Pleuronectes platessa TaxID=8262 RepID=A0A9N7TTD5_PLEPL|nr:unnamed protein product [Pleuronectes platessa]